MRNMKKRFILKLKVCLFLGFIINMIIPDLHANTLQNKKEITGVVTDTDGLPLIGASIVEKGTTNGTVADLDGKFSLSTSSGSTLSISYLGYVEQEIKTEGQQTFTIILKEDTQTLEEVVVVGYGTMRKKEVTGAVARVIAEDINKLSTSDVGSALQGQIAGVNVQASSGQPGSTANIQIRGISSINGNNNPLYIVDGVPYSGDPGLSPYEIESIDVLKDAASASIYGTRGAGGVILITTKSGKEGEMKISVDAYSGIQRITSGLELVNASETLFLHCLWNSQGEYMPENYTWHNIWNNTNMFVYDSELLDIVEQNNAPINNISLTLSGGSKNLTYNIVGNYYNQEGVLINSGYERYNIRANSTYKKNKWTINTSLSTKIDEQESPAWGLYSQIYKYTATSQQLDPDMSLSVMGGDQNVAMAMGTTMAKLKETNVGKGRGINANISVDYEILKGLTFNTRLAYGYNTNQVTKVNPLFEVYDQEGLLIENPNAQSGIRRTSKNNSSFSWENMLNYHLRIQKHQLKATAVFSMEKYAYDSFYSQRKDLISNNLPSLGATTGDMLTGIGNGIWEQDRISTLVGMMGRLQYNYAERYLLSTSVRKDGSSRFARNNRWGYFPSVSAGWNISEESFWDSLEEVVNSFKLRGSYGTTGNQNFGDYLSSATLSTLYDYAFVGSSGDILSLGSIQTAYSNANVKWETTEQYNIGIDVGLLNNKLTFTSDVYLSQKRDMLFPLKIPPIAGTGKTGTVVLNVGDMRNKGLEMALGWRDKIKNLNYRANLTYSRNINEITKMSGTNKRSALGKITTVNNPDNITFLQEGLEAGAFLMMPTNGIINTEEKLAEYQKLRSDAKMGDLMYIDSNEDGVLDDNDRVYCGSGAPEAEIGFNCELDWQGFDFSMNWYTSIGNEIVNGSKVSSYQNNKNKDMVYQWSIKNPYSSIPSYQGNNHYNVRSYADIWVEDGSFLRLKNIILGYRIPQSSANRLKLNKLRFYVAADNLLTFTKYDGYNPEMGNDGLSTKGLDMGNYPIAIQIRGGIQIEF